MDGWIDGSMDKAQTDRLNGQQWNIQTYTKKKYVIRETTQTEQNFRLPGFVSQ